MQKLEDKQRCFQVKRHKQQAHTSAAFAEGNLVFRITRGKNLLALWLGYDYLYGCICTSDIDLLIIVLAASIWLLGIITPELLVWKVFIVYEKIALSNATICLTHIIYHATRC